MSIPAGTVSPRAVSHITHVSLYTTPHVTRRTRHRSSPDNVRYNHMAHSYRSSRCEAISTLAARRYVYPCWDGVPEGGVAYTTPPVTRRTRHRSSPDNVRYNRMAHSYRSSFYRRFFFPDPRKTFSRIRENLRRVLIAQPPSVPRPPGNYPLVQRIEGLYISSHATPRQYG